MMSDLWIFNRAIHWDTMPGDMDTLRHAAPESRHNRDRPVLGRPLGMPHQKAMETGQHL